MNLAHALLALALLALSQTPALACESQNTSGKAIYLAAESPVRQPGAAQIGQGKFSYRFVVRDPQHIERPYRHGRYQVALKGNAVFPDGTRFYRGVADAQGRTAVFRFAAEVPRSDWFVLPLVGQGELGETFRLGDDNGCNQNLMVNYPYLLNIETGPVFCGHTLPGGYTPRFMSRKVENLRVYSATLDKSCRRLAKRLNPIMARSLPNQRLSGLEGLQRDRRLNDEHRELLQAKVDALVLRHGSLKQLRAMLQRQLAEVKDDSPKARSDIYNNLGYDLLVQDPPNQRAYAVELLEESVRLDENLFNLDSLAWAHHLAGREKAALELMNRGLALYGAQCSNEEQASLPIALAHRGMVQWTLGEYRAALDDWAQAQMMTRAGGWTNFIPDWQSIEPLITGRVAELQAEGYSETRCSGASYPDDGSISEDEGETEDTQEARESAESAESATKRPE